MSFLRKVSIIGAGVGGIVDIVATNLASLPVLLYVMSTREFVDLPRSQVAAQVLAQLRGSAELYITLGLLGCLCSVLGGYVAAVLAKRAEVLNGALSAWLCLSFSVYGMTTGQDQLPLWLTLLLLPGSPSLGALGGYLRLAQIRRKAPIPAV